MEDHSNENAEIKRVAREKRLHDIRTRARHLRRTTESTATWSYADRDRADLLIMYDLLEDELAATVAGLELANALLEDAMLRLGIDFTPGMPRPAKRNGK